MIICVPGGDLRQAPDPAVPRGQVGGAEARDEHADGSSAAAQVLRRLRFAHRRGVPGMLGVERVHDAAVHLDRLPRDELTDPAGQVLIRVRDVIDDHRHRPGIAGQGRRGPFLVAAAAHEADHPFPGRVDVRGIRRWVLLITCHEGRPVNRND